MHTRAGSVNPSRPSPAPVVPRTCSSLLEAAGRCPVVPEAVQRYIDEVKAALQYIATCPGERGAGSEPGCQSMQLGAPGRCRSMIVSCPWACARQPLAPLTRPAQSQAYRSCPHLKRHVCPSTRQPRRCLGPTPCAVAPQSWPWTIGWPSCGSCDTPTAAPAWCSPAAAAWASGGRPVAQATAPYFCVCGCMGATIGCCRGCSTPTSAMSPPPRCRAARHFGVVKALLEFNLLPRVVSGSSAGSIGAQRQPPCYSHLPDVPAY